MTDRVTNTRPHDELPTACRIAVDEIIAERVPLIDTNCLVPANGVASRSGEATSPGTLGKHGHERDARSLGRMVGYCAVAATVVVLLLCTTLIENDRTIAFAQVQEQIESVRSVQFMRTQSINIRIAGRREPPLKWRVMILGRYLKRTERLDEFDNVTSITIKNARTGEHVAIYPSKKLFRVLQRKVHTNLDTGEKTESAIKAWPEADFYATFRDFRTDPSQEPKRRQIDGRPAVGFVHTTVETFANGETETWTRTIWVDQESQLPMRIETSNRSTDKRLAACDWVEEQFEFDAQLDESLFSTEPPAGYRVEQSTIHGSFITPQRKP